MGIDTTRYIRKPLYVDAVQVTEENFDELVSWCNGTVEIEESNGKRFIRIWVHNPMGPRQTKAFVDDWILRHMKGFKIYTKKAFEASFDEVQAEKPVSNAGPVEEEITIKPATPEIVKEEVVRSPASLEGSAETHTVPANFEESKPVETDADVAVSDSPSAPPPVSTEGKRVLTVTEQETMGPEEVRELLKSGEAILEQDLAA